MDDQQKQPDMKKGEAVFERVMTRISSVLTPEDLKVIETLDAKDDEKGSMVMGYLKAKVPNFEAIMQEEMDMYKNETP